MTLLRLALRIGLIAWLLLLGATAAALASFALGQAGEQFILYEAIGLPRSAVLLATILAPPVLAACLLTCYLPRLAGWSAGRLGSLISRIGDALHRNAGWLGPCLWRYGRSGAAAAFRALLAARRSMQEAGRIAPLPRRDVILVLALAVPAQIFFVAWPMVLDCDAKMFIDYARFLTDFQGGFHFIRPPGFPLFIALTGTFLFDTLYLVIVLHVIMGILLPVLVYGILSILGRRIALIAAVAAIFSTLPFSLAKFFLADQLFLFVTFLGIYYLVRFYKTDRSLYLLASVATMTVGWFTRWEGQLLLLATFLALVFLLLRRRGHWRTLIASVAIPAVAIVVWSSGLALHTGDPRMLGKTSTGTPFQLMYAAYVNLPYVIGRDHRRYGWSVGGTTPIVNPLTDDRGFAIVAPSNGPQSQRLYDKIVDLLRDNPNEFQRLREPLSRAYQYTDPPRDFYELLFGRYEGDPKAFADSFFRHPTLFQLDFVMGEFEDRDGFLDTQNLLKAVVIEALSAHWKTAVPSMAVNSLSSFGINQVALMEAVHGRAPLSDAFFNLWVPTHYQQTVFNVGGCAESLPSSLFEEYRRDYQTFEGTQWREWIRGSDLFRNLFRNTLAPFFLVACVIVLFSRHWWLFVPVALGTGAMISAIGVLLGGTAGSRYEHMTLLLMLLVCAAAIETLVRPLLVRRGDRSPRGAPADRDPGPARVRAAKVGASPRQ